MKHTVVRYGTYGALICGIISVTSYVFNLDYDTSEIVGWIAILLGLSMIFFGIRYYRNNAGAGAITLGKGMQIGLLISLFPSFIFFLISLIIFSFFGEEFVQKAIDYAAEHKPEQVDKIRGQYETGIFSNPVISSLVMFFTVYLPGVIVSLISALVLKRTN
jgi:uncharacterized membrane protein